MTREDHLKFCKKCINRDLDINTGLICKLTGQVADFENNCPSFELDNEAIVENIDDNEAVQHSDVMLKLSDKLIEKFRSEQHLIQGITWSVLTGVIGAILWGAITVATNYQIGFMAIAIGAGVGYTMRFAGKGIDQIFGISGAIIAILSCLLGNFFSIIGFVADAENLGYIETLNLFDYSQLTTIMSSTFEPMDLVFYAIAAYEGYKFSFRTFTEKELYNIEKGQKNL